MKIDELRRLMLEQGLADAWWVNVDGISEPVPVTLLDVEGFVTDDNVGEVKVLNEAHATLDPAPWVAVGALEEVKSSGASYRVRPVEEEVSNRSPIGGCLVLVLVLGGLLYLGIRKEMGWVKSPPNRVVSESTQMKVQAEQAVRNRLKSPASAKFPPLLSYRVGKTDEGLWQVEGSVEAKNELGVLLRKQWIVQLEKSAKNTWEVYKVQID